MSLPERGTVIAVLFDGTNYDAVRELTPTFGPIDPELAAFGEIAEFKGGPHDMWTGVRAGETLVLDADGVVNRWDTDKFVFWFHPLEDS